MPSFTETPSASTNEVPNPTTANTSNDQTAQKSEAQLEADRLYEERIEEEYAKREGGA
ncbi:hypothetical protein OCU04_010373 [Sclerotinia nivalis]|uniref:Uncharacterized protein n=1 Tax=Sclerotinia nivalis TaxID=352851 RepID=A0A9X0AEE7_9HELO|nr:hypothetical protein OCU04_010373 [Sclerotinia nivalis]